MSMVTVIFLGEEYQITETINEFLDYDKILAPIRTKILNAIALDIKKDSDLIWDGDTMVPHIHDTADKYRNMVDESAALLVGKLLELGIYDVTKENLLDKVSTVGDINDLERLTFNNLHEEGHRFLNMKNAGMERAYNYAANSITGSGVRIFSNSFSSLMLFSAIERKIILSQAKKADKQYEEAISNLNSQTVFALDILYRKIMLKEFYPTMVQILLEFNSKIMSSFLVELISHGKFNFDDIENYDMQKAEEMLKNIAQVPDKVGFLKQVFLICPFCFAVYEACLKYGFLDKETFKTAKYFGFANELSEKIDEYIKGNLNNIEKITPLISILMSHRETNETEIWEQMYCNELQSILCEYKSFNIALTNKRELISFIRNNISKALNEVVKKSREDIKKSIDKKILSLVSEKKYDKLVELGLLSPESIRISGSSATVLADINNEIRASLVDCIMDYIEEAKQRLDAYNKAMSIYIKELKEKNNELSALESEKSNLGLLAFSKKKELAATIAIKTSELAEFKKILSEFKRTHEPKY